MNPWVELWLVAGTLSAGAGTLIGMAVVRWLERHLGD